jgi:2-keto-4-pentenoate hydratase
LKLQVRKAAADEQHTTAYLPAIEIVDDRYADWQTIGAPTLVADDFLATGCLLGKPVARSAAPELSKQFRKVQSAALGTGTVQLPPEIAAAGRRMGMSYKRAWYSIDTLTRSKYFNNR